MSDAVLLTGHGETVTDGMLIHSTAHGSTP